MKKILLSALLLIGGIAMSFAFTREGLTEYKLDNGLTVMLWEDHDQPDVTGYVVVRAGAVDEPAEYTGLAHYLEHMLFKGTQRIGALDWEKEKPMYDSIIALYDQYSETTDAKLREQLATQINEISMREAKISSTEDFFNMLDLIGAEGVNAYTSFDLTAYHNSFPAAEMYRWLTIFSDRLINPVFRTFQAELENVFEEYNMYANDPSSQAQKQLMEDIYKGSPYERDVIGLPEHLKNPRLSRLIEFYNTWYVPNNMALIIVGDFNTESTKPMIAETFGRLEPKELPARPSYPEVKLTGKKHYNLGYNPMVTWIYPGVKEGDPDQDVLDFVCALLYNGQTGLLDKVNTKGDVQFAGVFSDARRNSGRIIIEAVPYYDANQQMFEDDKTTEKIVMREVDKIKNGQIDDELIANVKRLYAQSEKVSNETPSAKMSALVDCFTYGKPTDDIFTANEKIQALTKDEIVRVAKKYFGADYMTISFDEDKKNVKPKTLPKPNIKPLDPVKDAKTEYAEAFQKLPKGELKQTFNDFNDVQVSSLGENVTMRYTKNTKNDIFTLTLRYGIGAHEMPMLPYATQLMENAGIQGNPAIEGKDFDQKVAELGGSVSYGCSDSYFTISISGEDENLAKIMNLVNRQLLMPYLEQKQLDAVKGSEFYSRLSRQKRTAVQKSALLQYALYGKKSAYLDEVKFADIWTLDGIKVQQLIASARTYALDVFYCGTLDKDAVVKELPLTEGMQPSKSPYIKDRVSYDKPTILFLPNSNVQQADLYFYINGRPYDISSDVASDAFNQYMSGGFTGVVLNEIRVKRSMAYTAYGVDATPALPGKECYFYGYVGTQSDKVADAINVYMDILTNMPQDSTNIASLKAALKQAAQTAKPSMRGKASTFEHWQRLGYTDDPSRVNAAAIDALTFSDIERFYEENIKGKPVTIILMGDPKKIDLKAIQQKCGCKVTKLSPAKLFNSTQELFDAIM
ncbi:MAG: insulinase family protein [Paludibacteraceae bacterium]|nr:insulinase family protein [Paludibacteraceae bacterium]MBQ2608039.1 insulinase family protein [Paludibacteraceae bacterium]